MLKKGDFAVFTIIVLISAVLFFALFGGEGKRVTVTVGGEVYGEYSLKENREIKLRTSKGTNTLVVKDGEAFFKDSDCPDKTCQKSGKISNLGETIVCLPHKVIAEVVE